MEDRPYSRLEHNRAIAKRTFGKQHSSGKRCQAGDAISACSSLDLHEKLD